jgi:hypothetical protein
MRDFFISYNKADRQWAEWVAWTLELNGYSTNIQAWDFPPGANFVLEMQNSAVECERTIAIISADYLAACFTQTEWAAAFAADPTGKERKLLPVRVAACEPAGILRSVVYCDLVGLDESAAKEALLSAVRGERSKPPHPPAFPGLVSKVYPVSAPRFQAAVNAPADVLAARELLDVLDTTRTTFQAQCRVRNKLVAMMRRRLKIAHRYQYEEFFNRYYSEMDDEERHLHSTIRAYTANVLSEYNQRALEIIRNNPRLDEHIPSLHELRRHLIVWISKYQGVFHVSPQMCLVYVGVEERVPFPKGIERELYSYLTSRSGRKQ